MNLLKAILDKVPELSSSAKKCEWAGEHAGAASYMVAIHRECCDKIEGNPYTCEMHLLELVDHQGESIVESHCSNCSKVSRIKINTIVDLES